MPNNKNTVPQLHGKQQPVTGSTKMSNSISLFCFFDNKVNDFLLMSSNKATGVLAMQRLNRGTMVHSTSRLEIDRWSIPKQLVECSTWYFHVQHTQTIMLPCCQWQKLPRVWLALHIAFICKANHTRVTKNESRLHLKAMPGGYGYALVVLFLFSQFTCGMIAHKISWQCIPCGCFVLSVTCMYSLATMQAFWALLVSCVHVPWEIPSSIMKWQELEHVNTHSKYHKHQHLHVLAHILANQKLLKPLSI